MRLSVKKPALIILTWLIMTLFAMQSVTAVSNPYPKNQTIDGVTTVPCTYVAWQEAYERTGIALPSWGNAVNWYSAAKKSGYSVGTQPRENSIAVYSGGGYGHVAYVISVDADSERMHIKQGGVTSFITDENDTIVAVPANGNGITEADDGYIVGAEYGGRFLTGFIYLDEPVKRPVTSSQQNPPISQSQPTVSNQTPSKGPNTAIENSSYLKLLTADAFDIKFEKDNFTYYYTVPNNIENVTIGGEAESSSAILTGCGEYSLSEGENTITVTVTAADKSVSNYVIYIAREILSVSDITSSGPLKNDDNGSTSRPIFPFIMIAVAVITAVAVASFFLLRKLKKRNNNADKDKA